MLEWTTVDDGDKIDIGKCTHQYNETQGSLCLYYCFLVFRRIGEYISLDLFHFVSACLPFVCTRCPLKSFRPGTVPCPIFVKTTGCNGRWHGSMQIRQNSTTMIRIITVASPNEMEPSQMARLGRSKCWGAWTLPAGATPRTSHHRSPCGERRGKRKRSTTFLERTRDGHHQSEIKNKQTY